MWSVLKAYGIEHHGEYLFDIWIPVWIENIQAMNIYRQIYLTIVFVILKA